jgi:hypothetical protein
MSPRLLLTLRVTVRLCGTENIHPAVNQRDIDKKQKTRRCDFVLSLSWKEDKPSSGKSLFA